MEETIKMEEIRIITHENIISYENLINSLPEDQKTPEVEEKVRQYYNREIELMQYYANAKELSMVRFDFYPFRKAGGQYIAEFEVKDLSKPEKNEYNWHLQNTSQWVYAGCILVQNGDVSTHH